MTPNPAACVAQGSAVLLGLIARLEAAVGPDRELDIEIQRAIDPDRDAWCEADAQRLTDAARRNGLTERDAACRASAFYSTPRYTACVTTALTLVPEKCEWFVQTYHFSSDAESVIYFNKHEERQSWTSDAKGFAKSAPLAICIAALRSRLSP